MLNKTIMFVAVAGLLLASASVSNAGIVAESWISGAPQVDGWACIDHYSGSPPAPTATSWNWGDDMVVGDSWGDPHGWVAELTIDGGSEVSGDFMSIGWTGGNSPQLAGFVTVTGAGSLLDVQWGLNGVHHDLMTIEQAGLVMVDSDGGLKLSDTAEIRMQTAGQLALEGAASDTLANFLASIGGDGSGTLMYWDADAGTHWAPAGGMSGGDYTLAAGTGDLTGYGVLTVGVIPEPSSATLLALGLTSCILAQRRSRTNS
jgi:hypothetical protein